MSPTDFTVNFASIYDTFSDAWSVVFRWCWLLTDTQRLLVPTAALIVILLWTKMCPVKRTMPATPHDDEALYNAAIERWSAASEANARQQMILQAAPAKPRRFRRW
jgi:hypothetical protein